MAYSALTIARYFLSLADENSGDLISNLKLQKLLYYAQGFSVALRGINNPLFEEDIYAWKHGPVVKPVYQFYSRYKSDALPIGKAPNGLDPKDVKFLDEMYRVFGKFSAWKLREMTHRESPWQDNYDPNIMDAIIPLKDLRAYFRKYVKT